MHKTKMSPIPERKYSHATPSLFGNFCIGFLVLLQFLCSRRTSRLILRISLLLYCVQVGWQSRLRSWRISYFQHLFRTTIYIQGRGKANVEVYMLTLMLLCELCLRLLFSNWIYVLVNYSAHPVFCKVICRYLCIHIVL